MLIEKIRVINKNNEINKYFIQFFNNFSANKTVLNKSNASARTIFKCNVHICSHCWPGSDSSALKQLQWLQFSVDVNKPFSQKSKQHCASVHLEDNC